MTLFSGHLRANGNSRTSRLLADRRKEIELGNKPLKGPLPRTASLPSYVEMNDHKVKSPNSSSVQHQGHSQQRQINPIGQGQVYREEQFPPPFYSTGIFNNQQFTHPPPNQHSQQVFTHEVNKQSLPSVRVPGTGGLVQQPNMYPNTTNMRPQNPQTFYRPSPQTSLRPNQQFTQMAQQPQGGQAQYQTQGMTYIMQPSQTGLGYGGGQIIVQPQILQGPRMNAQQYTGMAQTNTTGIQYTTMGQGTPQYSGYNTIMYAGPQANRPPSGPGMQQPFQTQQQQPPQQKREKKRLQIVDPNTGKDISEEILHTTAAAPNAPGSSRSTPPSGPGSGSRSTPVGSSQTHTSSDIPAQFAAKVAATLNKNPRQSPPQTDMSGDLPATQILQQESAPEVEQPTENNIQQQSHMDALPVSSQSVQSPVVEQPSSEVVQEKAVDIPPQEKVEPLREQQTVASVSDSISSTTSLSSAQEVVPETVVAAQSSNSENNSVSEKTDSSVYKDLDTPRPSSEVSADITMAEPPVETKSEVDSTQKIETKPETPASSVGVVKPESDSRTSVEKSDKIQTEGSVSLHKTETVVAPMDKPVREEPEALKPMSEAAASGEPTAEAVKDIKKSKKKAKELNKKGEGLSKGSDMDAFIDSLPPEMQPDSHIPEEKKLEDVVKAEPVTETVPAVEIRIENKSVQEENEKNQEKTKEASRMNSVEEKGGPKLKYKYKEDQWNPLNPEGKRLYDRDFLLQLQYASESTTKPIGLPDLPEIILEKPHSSGTGGGSRPSFGNIPDFAGRGSFDFTPGFVKGQRSSNSPMPKRGSATGRKGGSGNPQRIITISSQEVSLHKADSAWKPSRKQDLAKDEEDKKTEELYKKVRSILNKLTPQKFQTLVKQMSDLEINTEEKLKGVTDLVFEKAISEPGFSVAYASMCRYLTMVKVPSQTKSGDVNFRAILLTRCQREFEKDKDSEVELEKRRKEISECAEADNAKKDELKAELEIEETKARRRSLGNIRFIGELFKLKMLTENIMHDCLFKLLRAKDEESLECLCRLLFTIGKELETDKAKPRMDQYFNQMDKIVSEKKTSSRVRFMLQDVIELRHNKWVPRRDENNPKTLDQIHKEALKEEQERQIFLQQANANQKTQRGGGGGGQGPRGSRGPPTAGPMGSNDGWNTVGKPNIRVERQSIDPSRLKFSKQNLDESNIQLGPGGGANRFAGWQRGSTGGGARNSQETEKSSTPSNRFSALSKTEDESRSKFGVSPARGESRGRGFGRPPGRGVTPRSSQEQERERAIAAVKDVVGQTPTKGASRESSRGREQRRVDEKVDKPAAAPAKQLTNEEIEKKTKTILDEYLHIQDIKEAILCVEELNSSSNMHVFASTAVNHVIERSEKARNQTGLLLHDLVKKNILKVDCYIKGLTEILQFAEDMEIDIPKIWQYFGELIGPMVQDGSVPLQFLRQAAESLKPSEKSGLLVAEVLHAASHREGHKKVGMLWRQSSLQWDEFMPAEQVQQFIKDKKLEFTEGDGSQPSTPTVSKSIESIHEKLDDLLRENSDNEGIFDWIEENVDDPTIKSKKFVRALMTAVCQSAITGSGNSARVVPDTVKMRGVLLQKYLDHQAEFELQALYAVQALVHKLEHPPGVLRTLFDTLYDEDIISEDAFNQWEKSSDPAEQEGKGVAMKQVVQFFTWLRETEDFSDS